MLWGSSGLVSRWQAHASTYAIVREVQEVSLPIWTSHSSVVERNPTVPILSSPPRRICSILFTIAHHGREPALPASGIHKRLIWQVGPCKIVAYSPVPIRFQSSSEGPFTLTRNPLTTKMLGHFHLMFPKSWCSLNPIYFECALKTKKWRFQWFSGFVFSIKVGARKNFRVLCHGKAPSKKCISSRCRGCPMLLQLAVVLQSASWLAWLWTRRSDLSTRPTRGAWALKGVNLLFRRKHKVARSDRHARLGLFQAGRHFTSCTCQTVNSVNSRRQHRHVAHLQRAINLRPTL